MKNYKTEVTDNNRIEYLHFFGIKYPFIETDGMKIASDELEYAIRNHPNSPEGFELMEEIDCFLPEKKRKHSINSPFHSKNVILLL